MIKKIQEEIDLFFHSPQIYFIINNRYIVFNLMMFKKCISQIKLTIGLNSVDNIKGKIPTEKPETNQVHEIPV